MKPYIRSFKAKPKSAFSRYCPAFLFVVTLLAPLLIQAAYSIPECEYKIPIESVLHYYGLVAGIAGSTWFVFSTTFRKTQAEIYAKQKSDIYLEVIEQCGKLKLSSKPILNDEYLGTLKYLENKIVLYGSDEVVKAYKAFWDFIEAKRNNHDKALKHADEHFFNPNFFLRDKDNPESLVIEYRPSCDEDEEAFRLWVKKLDRELLPSTSDTEKYLTTLYEAIRNDYR